MIMTTTFYVAKEDDYYDIDAPVSVILANNIERHSKPSGGIGKSGVCMRCDKGFSLDVICKQIWDKLDDAAKSIILGYENGVNTLSYKPLTKPGSSTASLISLRCLL
jgi:hypothetical protein